MSDPIIASLDDAILRASDLNLLTTPTAWFNDRCIDFALEYMQNEHPDCAFLSASFAQLVKMSGGQGDLLNPLQLHEKRLVFVPINDCQDVSQPEGGGHWSLLLYEHAKRSELDRSIKITLKFFTGNTGIWTACTVRMNATLESGPKKRACHLTTSQALPALLSKTPTTAAPSSSRSQRRPSKVKTSLGPVSTM